MRDQPTSTRSCLGILLYLIFLASASAAATFDVTKTADTNDGLCDADCSVREAINAMRAQALTGGTHVVEIPAGTYNLTIPGAGEDLGATGDLDLIAVSPLADLTIRGAGRGLTVIDAGSLDRVLQIAGATNPIEISDLTMRGGSTLDIGQDGGGIFNTADLTLRRVALENNQVGPGLEDGGGLFNSGTATLIDCVVRNNSSADGTGGGIFNSGTLTVLDSSIEDNHADGPLGGGGGISSDASLTVERSTVFDNSAGGVPAGGGIFAREPSSW